MSYLVNTPTIKKKFCIHEFRKKYKQRTQECYHVCIKCGKKKKPRIKNQKIIPFLCPASKPSNPDYVEEHKFFSNWDTIEHQGYRLPATGEAKDECGLWKTKGCLDVAAHKSSSFPNMIFVIQFLWSCFRPLCKVCYKKWLGRQANRSTRRIEAYENIHGKKAIHIIISVPKWLYHLSDQELREKVHEIRKQIACNAGALIFHPFRFDKKSREFYYSPHFHIVGLGYHRGIKDHNRDGWFIKNLGRRKSTFQTFHYLLSHCGIKKGTHSVTWFGLLSYSKFPSEKYPESNVCPLCGRKLVEIYHDGVHPVVPPDQIFEGFLDPFDWYQVNTDHNQILDESFDYAPTRELNELLKGLVLAN